MKVIKVMFGDWSENFVCEDVLDSWEMLKGDGYINDYMMDVCNEEEDEFGELYFNIDEMLKLEGKVISKNGNVVDVKDVKWMGVEMNGEYEEMDYYILCDENCMYFKMLSYEDVEFDDNGNVIVK